MQHDLYIYSWGTLLEINSDLGNNYLFITTLFVTDVYFPPENYDYIRLRIQLNTYLFKNILPVLNIHRLVIAQTRVR